jgi:microcystin-dependent protein
MGEGVLGEIRLFAGDYAPTNWALCNGATLSIREYQALYALIGTLWGGDGVNTFKIPDLRGRVPVGQGQGTNLTNRVLAQTGGASTVGLTVANLPTHNHTLYATNQAATTATVAAGVGLATPLNSATGPVVRYASPTASPAPTVVQMDPLSINNAAGGSQPHYNLMPYLALNYIICTLGLFPNRP